MSIETTLARQLAGETGRAWRDHWTRVCVQCSQASRARKRAEMCPDGQEMYDANREAQRQLAHQRALDKQPITGQGHLF